MFYFLPFFVGLLIYLSATPLAAQIGGGAALPGARPPTAAPPPATTKSPEPTTPGNLKAAVEKIRKNRLIKKRPEAPKETPELQQQVQVNPQQILDLIDAQLTALENRDLSKAYFTYTSDAFRNATTFDQFQYFVEHYSIFSHNKNALFGNPEFRQHFAILRGLLTSTDGASSRVQYLVTQEGNQWKVLGIEIIPAPLPEQGVGPTKPGT